MAAVPRRWTRKSPMMTPRARGMTKGFQAGDATSIPSMADSTEMAGVMTPSP